MKLNSDFTSSSTSSSGYFGPPPTVDFSRLENFSRVDDIDTAIANSAKDYDELAASTQAMGFQGAAAAAKQYSGRLLQQGINPVAAGVVEAQSRLPVYQQLASIKKDKNAATLDATTKAASIQADIEKTLGNLRLGYANTIADYNYRQSTTNLETRKLNQSQQNSDRDFTLQQGGLDLQRRKLDQDAEMNRAQIQAINLSNQMKQAELNPRLLTSPGNSWLPNYSTGQGGGSIYANSPGQRFLSTANPFRQF